MANKAKQHHPDSFEGIENALTRTEQFIEDNSKPLTYVIGGIIVVILLVMGARKFYINPLEKEAAGQMFMAEKFFERDSFNLALNGYGTYPGFLQIDEDYGITKTANLAEYYAGVCFLNLKDYENAIDYLKSFKTKDLLMASAKYSSLGDAYVELQDYSTAAKNYLSAIEDYSNEYSTPILLKKLGLVYEEMGDFKRAKKYYEVLKSDYPDSEEARDIEKYITRSASKM